MATLVDATPYREAGMKLWRRFSWPELARIAGVPPETARRVTLGITRSVRRSTAERLDAWVERARKLA